MSVGPSTTNRKLANILYGIEPLVTQDGEQTRVYLLTAKQEQALHEAYERINESPDER